MTIAINRTACSAEFMAAFDALEAGKSARRESWPTGQFIKRRKDNGSIVVVREGAQILPIWHGPSSAESDATDWIVI